MIRPATPYAQAVDGLDALYAALPTLGCQQHCQESCGVVVMTRVEWVRITRQLGYAPKGKPSLQCPMLKQGRCVVYAIRPLLCRLYGLLSDDPRMQCPWGCRPTTWLTSAEGFHWLAQAATLSAMVFPDADPGAFAFGVPLEHLPALVREARQQGGGAPLGEDAV